MDSYLSDSNLKSNEIKIKHRFCYNGQTQIILNTLNKNHVDFEINPFNLNHYNLFELKIDRLLILLIY